METQDTLNSIATLNSCVGPLYDANEKEALKVVVDKIVNPKYQE